MSVLVIRGTLGSEHYAVRCTEDDLEGSPPIQAWLLGELGDQPYSLEAMRDLAPRLSTMFGETLEIIEEPDDVPVPEPEGIPAPQEVPPPLEEPAEEPAAHALREQ